MARVVRERTQRYSHSGKKDVNEDRAEVEVMLPQAKEHLEQPEGGRDRRTLP